MDGTTRQTVRTDALAGSGQTVFTATRLASGPHTITVTDTSGELAVGSFQVPAQPYLNLRAPAAAFDNSGVSIDSDTGAASLDGLGLSLSASALVSAGVTPGSTVTAGGVSFTWPAGPAGQPDNVILPGVSRNAPGGALHVFGLAVS